MKKVILFLSLILFALASCQKPVVNTKPTESSGVIKQMELRIDTLNSMVKTYEAGLVAQQNAILDYKFEVDKREVIIQELNKKIMREGQFIELYKYKRLEKYYKLCKQKPNYWKYYKGWSTRVFELQNKNYKPTDSVPDFNKLE